ncbi:alpha-ribazole phosphatase family protein [Mariprofundus sp. NF]|uniref:histidine phosphatase family protein n=1 Tax=Mariprofundus sp. NF TaxID=2608716 RepID=UPI0015A25F04|nr:alpha-ribazole phosphatase family protein [Mariprofundus sp. NF]NWF37590.1 alpha-ribazole phosphatase family protein [Mariprofundus sp. NF]
MSEPTIITLLRHGEVEAEGWAFRGSTDIPLSELGWSQMRAAATGFDGLDHIATSPLQRCKLFARELSEQSKAELITLDAMAEMDFGDWENRSFDEISGSDREVLQQFWESPVAIQPPNGEAFDAFSQRVINCWQEWVNRDVGQNRLLVAHGGVIRVLLAHTLNMPMSALWRLHLPYASCSQISLFEGHQPRLLFINREVQS